MSNTVKALFSTSPANNLLQVMFPEIVDGKNYELLTQKKPDEIL